MKATEFIKEYKIVDRILADRKLRAATILFNRIKNKYNNLHDAMLDAAKMADLRPRLLQDYLINKGLLESFDNKNLLESFDNKNLLESYIAFEIDKKSRNKLKKIFPPKYPDFIGHHITYKFGVDRNIKIPNTPKKVEVVGYIDNGKNLEALVVSINGKINRPDGKIYHITWSLNRSEGIKPVQSNNLLQSKKYQKIKPIAITVKSKLFD